MNGAANARGAAPTSTPRCAQQIPAPAQPQLRPAISRRPRARWRHPPLHVPAPPPSVAQAAAIPAATQRPLRRLLRRQRISVRLRLSRLVRRRIIDQRRQFRRRPPPLTISHPKQKGPPSRRPFFISAHCALLALHELHHDRNTRDVRRALGSEFACAALRRFCSQ